MKPYFVALLIASSFFLSIVDTGIYQVEDNTKIITPSIVEVNQICGPNTFSSGVKSAFARESDLDRYSSAQLYLTKEWVVVFKEPHCTYELSLIHI